MPDNRNRVETEEERRQRIRRMRRRRELQRKRRRRKRILRIVRLAVIAAIIIAVIVVVTKTVTKIQKDRAAADLAASSAEAEANLDEYEASDVLNLSFPVLTLDRDYSSDDTTDGTEDSDADGADETEDAAEETDADNSVNDDAAVSSSDGAEQKYATPLTVTEFNNILQQLYDNNYVLVNIYSLASASDENGMTAKKVSVPKGKKPLLISQQDASYKNGYDGHADQLIIGDDGLPVCTYTQSDGTQARGAVDVVPCVEAFLKTHPDFSYNGARGIIGVTGYQGILGYSIAEQSEIIGALSNDAVMAAGGGTTTGTGNGESVESTSQEISDAEENTKEDYDETIGKLKNVISALRSSGWQFACNSFADISYASSYDLVKSDLDEWESGPGSILGTTDIMLMAGGGDLDGWDGYQDANEKYQYLEQKGFRYYCVENDGEQTWIQVKPGYARIGMHEIDSSKQFNSVMGLK